MAYFPFMIDISDKKCLVIGGGNIAFHKVRLLLDFDVCIKVIGITICQSLKELENKYKTAEGINNDAKSRKTISRIEIIQKKFDEEDLEDVDFVIAATDEEELNIFVSDLCRQRRIPVNVVDKKEACSFIFPAIIQNKDLLVAVSSNGQSPAAAAYVKQQLLHHIPDYYGDMIETLGEYRDDVFQCVRTPEKRKNVFWKLLEYGEAHKGRLSKEVVDQIIKEMKE